MIFSKRFNIFRPKKYTVAELNQLFADKNKRIDTNISPENLMINTSKKAQRMTDGEKNAKYYRKSLGEPTKYDKAEDVVFDVCFSISDKFYAKPDKFLGILNNSLETKELLIKVYYLLNSFKKEASEPLDFSMHEYVNELRVNYSERDEFLHLLNKFIDFAEANESIINEALEMEELSEERIESTLKRIRWLFSLDEENFKEEMAKRS